MSSTVPATSRKLFEVLRPIRRRVVCSCASTASIRNRSPPQAKRCISTASSNFSEMEVESGSHPRWSQTPSAMRAPVRTRPRPEGVKLFAVNSDPQKLDDFYSRFLGREGPKMLSDETKWLAVTHKSFDHGRRGFNDRLSFLGKRIVELQASLSLLSSPGATRFLKDYKDPHGREPFQHPAIDAIEGLAGGARTYFIYHKQVSKVAEQYGISSIIRWQPRMPDNLALSGQDMVNAQAVFAIIGALALEQGGEVANRIAKERVLLPQGLRTGVQSDIEKPQ